MLYTSTGVGCKLKVGRLQGGGGGGKNHKNTNVGNGRGSSNVFKKFEESKLFHNAKKYRRKERKRDRE